MPAPVQLRVSRILLAGPISFGDEQVRQRISIQCNGWVPTPGMTQQGT